jgi:hypothetical protein
MIDPELAAALAAINHKLDAMQPFLDGIPVLGKSIEVLQRDVRTLRDDLHVTSAMAMRVDTTLSNLPIAVTSFSISPRFCMSRNTRPVISMIPNEP